MAYLKVLSRNVLFSKLFAMMHSKKVQKMVSGFLRDKLTFTCTGFKDLYSIAILKAFLEDCIKKTTTCFKGLHSHEQLMTM